MNYNKNALTVKQFLNLLEVDSKYDAPIGVPFLMSQVHKSQKKNLVEFMKALKEENFLKFLEQKSDKLRITYWIRRKDGNVQDEGAHIIVSDDLATLFSEILAPEANANSEVVTA